VAEGPDPSRRLADLLRSRGVGWPAAIEHALVVDSTNERLKEQARNGAPEWSAILAERQTAGRGRHGHAWISPAGNLHLSVLLRPALPAHSWGVLPLAAGLAVCEAVSELGVAAHLKWPNDVLVRGRKLAGILVEAVSGGRGLECAVVGVGVNVAAAPSEDATALAVEGVSADLPEVAAAVLARLRVCYDALAREGAEAVVLRWRQRAVEWWGTVIELHSAGQVRRGVARGVDERGALLFEDASGRVEAIVAGEAREVRSCHP
jgi:BirA family biotin operon repressor/biotin-[acetyl-CoA-carboxylase] ligase